MLSLQAVSECRVLSPPSQQHPLCSSPLCSSTCSSLFLICPALSCCLCHTSSPILLPEQTSYFPLLTCPRVFVPPSFLSHLIIFNIFFFFCFRRELH